MFFTWFSGSDFNLHRCPLHVSCSRYGLNYYHLQLGCQTHLVLCTIFAQSHSTRARFAQFALYAGQTIFQIITQSIFLFIVYSSVSQLFSACGTFWDFFEICAHLAKIRCSLKNRSLHFASVSNLSISRRGHKIEHGGLDLARGPPV